MELPQTVHSTYNAFITNPSLFALPLQFQPKQNEQTQNNLTPLPVISNPPDPQHTFQHALSQLDSLLSPKTPLYLLIRHNGALAAVTFVPWLANPELKTTYLDFRVELVRALGEQHFGESFICKEVTEVTDARSWEERALNSAETEKEECGEDGCETCTTEEGSNVKDLGYKKNKCRLCDRRMKNPIETNASDALKTLQNPGSLVQLAITPPSLSLQLLLHPSSPISPSSVHSLIPTTTPSFTFYRHSNNSTLYFIFCSPDSCTVKQRMTHTMAVAGLVGVVAKEHGANVDQTLEIHEPEDLDFGEGEGDERIGRFRSVYQLGGRVGTESVWVGMPES